MWLLNQCRADVDARRWVVAERSARKKREARVWQKFRAYLVGSSISTSTVSTSAGISLTALVSILASIASRMFRSASSRERPCDTHPGRAGHSATNHLSSSCSIVTTNFFTRVSVVVLIGRHSRTLRGPDAQASCQNAFRTLHHWFCQPSTLCAAALRKHNEVTLSYCSTLGYTGPNRFHLRRLTWEGRGAPRARKCAMRALLFVPVRAGRRARLALFPSGAGRRARLSGRQARTSVVRVAREEFKFAPTASLLGKLRR